MLLTMSIRRFALWLSAAATWGAAMALHGGAWLDAVLRIYAN